MHVYQSLYSAGVWGRQRHSDDDSQVWSTPPDFSSAPTCLAGHIHVSQHTCYYDNHLPCLIFGFVYCCMLSSKQSRLAFNYIDSHIALLCRSCVCHLSSVWHVHRLCKIPVSGQSCITTRTTKIGHQCAAANAEGMAHFVCMNPSIFYNNAVRHLSCCKRMKTSLQQKLWRC